MFYPVTASQIFKKYKPGFYWNFQNVTIRSGVSNSVAQVGQN